MDITKYFKRVDVVQLPEEECFKVANVAVSEELAKIRSVKRKRTAGGNRCYNDETKTKIARYAAENGNASAVRKFSEDLGWPVPESTVRNFKEAYLTEIRKGTPVSSIVITSKSRGRPLLLGELDAKVQDYIRKLRLAGGIVTSSIVIASAKGIVCHYNRALLPEHGGNLVLSKKWAQSIMTRMGLVKRKATKAARKVPQDFQDVKAAFLHRIKDTVNKHAIPDSMIVNFDQTGSKFVPCSEWTMAPEGSKQVEVTGLNDKREMTVVLAVSLAGELLPPQLIYAGTTNRCHTTVTFPDNWSITHSKNHWSNETTMLEFIATVLVPFMVKQREKLQLPLDQAGLAIFDVFAAHRTDAVLKKLEECNIKQVFIPGGCTGELQPLDVAVNGCFKMEMKKFFTI